MNLNRYEILLYIIKTLFHETQILTTSQWMMVQSCYPYGSHQSICRTAWRYFFYFAALSLLGRLLGLNIVGFEGILRRKII